MEMVRQEWIATHDDVCISQRDFLLSYCVLCDQIRKAVISSHKFKASAKQKKNTTSERKITSTMAQSSMKKKEEEK